MRRERLDDAALRDLAAVTLTDQMTQFPGEAFEIGDLPLHIRKVLTRDAVHFGAVPVLLVGKRQQGSDLFDGKAQPAHRAMSR